MNGNDVCTTNSRKCKLKQGGFFYDKINIVMQLCSIKFVSKLLEAVCLCFLHKLKRHLQIY